MEEGRAVVEADETRDLGGYLEGRLDGRLPGSVPKAALEGESE